jgi:hypothetical protein
MNDKPTQAQIVNFVDQLVYSNEMVWNAICSTSDLFKSDVYKFLMNNDEKKTKDLIQQIATSFKIYSNESLSKPELYGENFENFEGLGKLLNEFLK